MAVKLAFALCLVLAGLTVRQHAIWQSNLTLWTHAVAVTPNLARPAINLAVAYRANGWPAAAARQLILAGPLTERDPRGAEYRRLLAQEMGRLESFGTFVCDQPSAQPYC